MGTEKRVFYAEVAYLAGVAALAFGTALMEAADFGVSMVVAPAYLIYLKLSQAYAFFTFGMAEYLLQAALLLALMLLLRRARVSYLFSFITSILYGLLLDGSMALIAPLPTGAVAVRIALYVAGMLVCAVGVSLLFHTYLPPEVYELFVKEASQRFGIEIHRFKTLYDCASCLIGIGLSFAFFGLWRFEGVKLGTILCAVINGRLIGYCSRFFERRYTFADGLPIRKFFER